MYRRLLKRMLDFALALLGLVALLPLLLALAAWIRLDSRGPVLFRQRRVGKGKRLFDILKFRTMSVETPCDTPTHLLSDSDQWITRAGRFLRKTSLDELPQLINILKGEMSIVGPRPALWNQHDLIAAREARGVNDVRPGLSGWAQVNGRDALSIPEKVGYDAEYCRNITIGMDCKCLLGTVWAVARQKGYAEGNATPRKHDLHKTEKTAAL